MYKRYVVGLLFDEFMEHVVLLQKKHGPDCVVGNWNGVGGKIENEESPVDAMVREFFEEAGVQVSASHWQAFCTLVSKTHVVYFFWAKHESWSRAAHATTDEPVSLFHVDELPNPIMHNLRWMIPFVCDNEILSDMGVIKTSRTV